MHLIKHIDVKRTSKSLEMHYSELEASFSMSGFLEELFLPTRTINWLDFALNLLKSYEEHAPDGCSGLRIDSSSYIFQALKLVAHVVNGSLSKMIGAFLTENKGRNAFHAE